MLSYFCRRYRQTSKNCNKPLRHFRRPKPNQTHHILRQHLPITSGRCAQTLCRSVNLLWPVQPRRQWHHRPIHPGLHRHRPRATRSHHVDLGQHGHAQGRVSQATQRHHCAAHGAARHGAVAEDAEPGFVRLPADCAHHGQDHWVVGYNYAGDALLLARRCQVVDGRLGRVQTNHAHDSAEVTQQDLCGSQRYYECQNRNSQITNW